MNCSSARQHLSGYHDDELEPDLCAAMAEHLASCSECARCLTEIQELSRLATELTTPTPPEDMWPRLESKLGSPQTPRRQTFLDHLRRRKRAWTTATAAALVLVGISAAVLIWMSNAGEHNHVAVNFGHYLDEFERNPDEAQRVLLSNYSGQAVTLDVAATDVRYRPVAPTSLPNGLSLDAVYLLRMPCCTCVQAVYKREDGEKLAVFEHVDDQPVWFGNRPTIKTRCNGVPASLIQVNDRLAATWQRQGRYITVVGPRDVKQVAELVDVLDRPQPDRQLD